MDALHTGASSAELFRVPATPYRTIREEISAHRGPSLGGQLGSNPKSTLVENFRTSDWPRASDLKELVVGSKG